jgi:hypothetical protein
VKDHVEGNGASSPRWGGARLGSWKLEVGSWKLEVGS